MKKIYFFSISLLMPFLAGCESDALLSDTDVASTTITVRSPMLDESGNPELPAETDFYQFDDGKLVRKERVTSSGEIIDVTTQGNTKVYCVAGTPIESNTGETTLEDFLSCKISSPADASSAPIFYAGGGDLDTAVEETALEMCHGVARIDLACEDPRMVIKEVIVENAPASSYIINNPSAPEDNATVTYSRSIGEDFEGFFQQAFTIFETTKGVTLRVKGKFDGDPMNFSTTIPVVKRNKIYTLGVSGGSAFETSITISDWSTGDNGEGIIELGEAKINLELSDIPEGVIIDPLTNDIKIPASGVEDMKLAFVTSAPLRLGNILGSDDSISVESLGSEESEEGYVTKFSVNVQEQPKCARAYGITVMFNGDNGFYINMNVEESPYQIPTVHIGGHDWMCFNAISNDVDEQIYIMEGGPTVEEMYNGNFTESIGNYFMFGRSFPLSPWQSYDLSLFTDMTMDKPWTTPGKVPLPKGYHIPTLAEWQDLIPNKTTIPASYRTASGDSIKATLVTLPGTLITPSAAVNAKNFKMRYILFESISSGAKLYLPIAGLKTAANVEVPGYKNYLFDTNGAYWTRNDRDILFITYKTLEGGVEGAYLEQGRWGYDGTVSVRGIKD